MKRSVIQMSLVVVLILCCRGSDLAAKVPNLFEAVKNARDIPSTKNTKRARILHLDSKLLTRGATDAESTIRLNLFPNVSIEGLIESTRVDGPDKFVTKGRITWTAHDNFVFVVRGDIIAGTVSFADRQFRVLSLPNGQPGQVVVSELNPPKKDDCGCGEEHHIVSPPGKPSVAADDGSTVDVLVAYTPAARAAVGGVANIEALIDLAVEETNDAYQASLVIQRVRLVHAVETNYNESAGFNTALSNLRSTSDGEMDEIHTLRNTYGADLVSLFIDDSSSCGLAYLMTNESAAFASNGFSVVHWGCATGYYSFAHELGHNMGLAHDRGNAGSAVRPYAYGWRWNSNQYRSIMAYAPGTRVPRFSNPNVTYSGGATGVANSEENARALDGTRNTVANFRQSVGGQSPVITSPSSVTVKVNTSFSYSITASGSPTSFGATGLPGGLAVNPNTGLISGTPTITGNYPVLLSATNSGGTGTMTLSLTVSSGGCLASAAVDQFKKKWGIPVPLELYTSTLPTLRKLRDELLLPHPEGRKLVDNYYEHGKQLTPMLVTNPVLTAQATPLLLEILPNIQAGIKADGTFRLSSDQYENVLNLLTAVESEAQTDAGKWVGEVQTMFVEAARKENDGVVIELSKMLQTR